MPASPPWGALSRLPRGLRPRRSAGVPFGKAAKLFARPVPGPSPGPQFWPSPVAPPRSVASLEARLRGRPVLGLLFWLSLVAS